MMINKFQVRTAVYTCGNCGKKTRETGHGESELELCAYCLREGLLENSLSDGNISQEAFDVEIQKLKVEYDR